MSGRTMRFVAIGAPRGKERPRVVRTKGGGMVAFTPTATRTYESAIAWAARAAGDGLGPFEGPLALTLRAVMPMPKRFSRAKRDAALIRELRPETKPDLDNVVKAVLDALNKVAFRDDAQVVSISASKEYGLEPGIHVTLEELT